MQWSHVRGKISLGPGSPRTSRHSSKDRVPLRRFHVWAIVFVHAFERATVITSDEQSLSHPQVILQTVFVVLCCSFPDIRSLHVSVLLFLPFLFLIVHFNILLFSLSLVQPMNYGMANDAEISGDWLSVIYCTWYSHVIEWIVSSCSRFCACNVNQIKRTLCFPISNSKFLLFAFKYQVYK